MDLPLFAVPDGKEALRGGRGRIVFIQIACNEQKENTKKYNVYYFYGLYTLAPAER